ncbi:MAG: hypothetical protein ABI835_10645, partial [Chloroflexota bacterium]
MFNDPPPERRKPHPLEREPVQPPPSSQPPSQQVTLRIPSVKPNVTYAIIAINVAVFLIRATSPQLDQQIFLWGANHPPEHSLRGLRAGWEAVSGQAPPIATVIPSEMIFRPAWPSAPPST